MWDSAAWLAAEGGDELARMLLRLRLWAVYYLNGLAGSARQAIAVVSRWQWTPNGCWARTTPAPGLAEQPRQRPQGGERAGLNRALRGA